MDHDWNEPVTPVEDELAARLEGAALTLTEVAGTLLRAAGALDAARYAIEALRLPPAGAGDR